MQWLFRVSCSETQIYWLDGGAVNFFSMLSSSFWHFNFGTARIFLYEIYFEHRILEHFYGSPLCELCSRIAEMWNQLLKKSEFLYIFPGTKILRQTLNLPKLWYTMKFDHHHWFKGKACGVIPSNTIIVSPLYVGGWQFSWVVYDMNDMTTKNR